ncbi:MAG TPA: XdhC family protein [Chitinophagaceae bacterium]
MIIQNLETRVPVMLLYVLESKGSSPGRQGFFMTVNINGNIEGSIGGGIMEHKFIEMVREKLRAGNADPIAIGSEVRKQIHDKSAAKHQSGMICSGEQAIWLYTVPEKDKSVIQHIIASLSQNKNGTLTLSASGIAFTDAVPQKDVEFAFRSEEDWLYKEKTGYKNKLFIVGGGHCALALSTLMRALDFYIHVYDDRKDLKTLLQNNAAHEKHVLNDYSELSLLIAPGNNHYIIIMTVGYRTDDIAIKALLEKECKWLGVLGSKSKIRKMMAEYRKAGVKEELLQRIQAPVGLAINSQTPEEIAVSIAAQIIQVKNSSPS